jgi:hypothetical protein
MKVVFAVADTNGDGALSVEELQLAYQALG